VQPSTIVGEPAPVSNPALQRTNTSVASMRRPPGVNTFFVEVVHGRAKHRTAALPFALDEGPPKGPGACWGPTRTGAGIYASSSLAPATDRSHPNGAVRSFDLLWTFLRSESS
jgi:hypothetical protein